MRSTTYLDIPLTKPSKAAIKKQAKLDREKDINRMNTGSILWFLYRRHEIGILYMAVTVLAAYLILNKMGII